MLLDSHLPWDQVNLYVCLVWQVILKTALLAKTGKPFFIVPQVGDSVLTYSVVSVCLS